jgi:hypothetical protein
MLSSAETVRQIVESRVVRLAQRIDNELLRAGRAAHDELAVTARNCTNITGLKGISCARILRPYRVRKD